MQDLSRKMEASFRHILRKANSMADGLPKEGVLNILSYCIILISFCFSLYLGGCSVCSFFFWWNKI